MLPPLLLVVDDLPEVLLIVRRYGQRAGHQVIGCLNVLTAWEHLRGLLEPSRESEPLLSRRPDLVLIDVNLPAISGLELCRRIRSTPALADLALGLFSQWSQSQDVAAGLDAGVDFMVAKDLLRYPEQWQARVEEILAMLHGRPSEDSLSWKGSQIPRAHLEESVRGLNRALEQLSLRRFGPEIVQALLRRAFRDVEARLRPTPAEQGGDSDLFTNWLREDGGGLVPEHVVLMDRPELLARVALALRDRLWCLVGTRESEGFAKALRAGVPLLAECPSLG